MVPHNTGSWLASKLNTRSTRGHQQSTPPFEKWITGILKSVCEFVDAAQLQVSQVCILSVEQYTGILWIKQVFLWFMY